METSAVWPSLPLAEWQETHDTLHMWMQMVGKTRLALAPRDNHWWHVALYTTSRGLTTTAIPYRDGVFEAEFDFLDHVLVVRTSDGTSRAIALSSTTPAPADATPIEIAAAPVSPLQSRRLDKGEEADATVAGRVDPDRPRYADLIDPDKIDSEQRCLAEAVYFEARGEPAEGQAAVAQVVLNRVKSGLYPSSICGVVYQNKSKRNRCQFSFACDGIRERITNKAAWAEAQALAKRVMDDDKTLYIKDVGASTHYHATYVRPRWARHMTKKQKIGRHIFYQTYKGGWS